MPKVVVRKSYRCQPGRRRDVLTALQRIDAAAASVGYPRGRYLFVETRSPGDPDLEVEFAFESYAEMEQLERRMREHVARFLREGGSTGQEFLLEPSATRYLLLVEEGSPAGRGASQPAARVTTAAPGAAAAGTAGATAGTGASGPGGQPGSAGGRAGSGGRPVAAQAGPGGQSRGGAGSPGGPARAAHNEPPPDLTFDDDEDPFEGFDDLPEPDVPPAPEVPEGMTAGQFQASQLAKARAALAGAESAVNLQPRPGAQDARGAGGPAPRRQSRQPERSE